MGRGSVTSSIERRAIGMCFERTGAEVVDIEEATFEAFRASYEDPSVDAVWFCSHGSQDHARPHLSGLHLDDGEFATLSQLNALQLPPSERRRLLVLNVCDAGSSPMLEGPLSLGVAAVIAHRTQSVISYLWPVNPFVAAAFAALLAHELTADPDHPVAFRRALRALGTGQQPIASRLRDAGLVDVAERVENNNISWNSVFAWGSPVMLL